MGYEVNNDDFVELTVRAHYQLQEIDNVFWFRIGTNGSTVFPVDSSDIIRAWRNGIWRGTAHVLDGLAQGYIVDQYILRLVDITFPGGPPKWKFDNVDAILGESPDDEADGSVTGLDTFSTVNIWFQATPSGRSGRGRKSMSPIQEADTKDTAGGANELTDTALAYWQSVADLMKVDFDTAPADPAGCLMKPRIASLKNYVASSSVANTWRVVTGATVRRFLGSQVSRKAKNRFA